MSYVLRKHKICTFANLEGFVLFRKCAHLRISKAWERKCARLKFWPDFASLDAKTSSARWLANWQICTFYISPPSKKNTLLVPLVNIIFLTFLFYGVQLFHSCNMLYFATESALIWSCRHVL